MKKFLSEFKEFIMRGNVLDMAVGVIVATAFGKITTSLVNDLFMPFISWLFGTRDMSALNLIVRPEIVENGAVVQEAITIGFGNFVAVNNANGKFNFFLRRKQRYTADFFQIYFYRVINCNTFCAERRFQIFIFSVFFLCKFDVIQSDVTKIFYNFNTLRL